MRRRDLLGLPFALPLAALSAQARSQGTLSRAVRVVGPGPPPTERGLRPSALAAAPSHGVGPLLSSALYERLTNFDSSGRLVPGLATSWEGRRLGKQWVFALRPEVDARGVLRYLSRLCSPASPLKYSTWSLESVVLVERWSLGGDHILVADLVLPLDTFPRLVATPVYRLPGAVAGVHGPYEVASFSEGSERWALELKPRGRGQTLRGTGRSPILVITESDPSVRARMVADGDADVALSVEGAGPRALSAGLAVRYRPDLFPVLMVRSVEGLPDPSALARLLGRSFSSPSVLRAAYGGYGEPGDGSVALRWSPLMPPPQSCRASDALLADARNRLSSVSLALVVHNPDYLRLGRALSQAWRVWGIDLTVKLHRGPRSSLWEQPLVLAPWAVREDTRLLFWGFSDPRRSGLAWSPTVSDEHFSMLFNPVRLDLAGVALRRILDQFRCDAPAVVPVLPDRVDLWASTHARFAPYPLMQGRRCFGNVLVNQLSRLV